MALDYKILGKRLKIARKQKGLTQENLAEKMNVSVAFISRVENGTIEVNLKRISEICGLLEVDEGYILNGTSTTSKEYLNNDLSTLLKNCPPEKIKLIYDISKVILNQEQI